MSCLPDWKFPWVSWPRRSRKGKRYNKRSESNVDFVPVPFANLLNYLVSYTNQKL